MPLIMKILQLESNFNRAPTSKFEGMWKPASVSYKTQKFMLRKSASVFIRILTCTWRTRAIGFQVNADHHQMDVRVRFGSNRALRYQVWVYSLRPFVVVWCTYEMGVCNRNVHFWRSCLGSAGVAWGDCDVGGDGIFTSEHLVSLSTTVFATF